MCAHHCCRSRTEVKMEVHLRALTHGHTIISRPGSVYIPLLFADIGCRLENLPRVRENWDE